MLSPHACPGCGSRTWTSQSGEWCSNCPKPLGDRIATFVAALVLLGIIFGAAAGYGALMYGNWRCGMPYVQCRIVEGL